MNGVVGDYIIICEVMWRMNTHLWRWAGAGNSCELLLVLLVTIFWRFWRSATGPDTGQSACHLPNHDTSMILTQQTTLFRRLKWISLLTDIILPW